MDEMIVPDIIGKIEGWRLFTLDSSGLKSYSANYYWKPGVNEATCISAGQKIQTVWKNGPNGKLIEETVMTHTSIPDPDCGCGFWIYKKYETCKNKTHYNLGNNFFGGLGSFTKSFYIDGMVNGWGKVIEGEDGYRTEFAEIVKLYTHDKMGGAEKNMVVATAQKYNVPIEEAPRPIVAEKATMMVKVKAIGPLILGASGRYRPREIFILPKDTKSWKKKDSVVYYCWENMENMDILTEAQDSKEVVKIEYEINTYLDKEQKMIISAKKVGEDRQYDYGLPSQQFAGGFTYSPNHNLGSAFDIFDIYSKPLNRITLEGDIVDGE
jgi:hypothetical protein